MSIILTVNGNDFFYPETGDLAWGSDATDWANAVTTGMLQKSGGTFQLLAETDFGTGFGLKSLYYKSRTANTATSGQLRLAKTDTISFRNNANDFDLGISIDGSDQLTWVGQYATQTVAMTSIGSSTLSTDTVVRRNTNGNFITNNIFYPVLQTFSAAQTVTMTVDTPRNHVITGTSTVIFTLPDATTLYNGCIYEFINNSTGTVTIKNTSGTTIATLLGNTHTSVMCTDTFLSAGVWTVIQYASNPMTTAGDLILGGTSGAQTRLPIGSNGYVLTSNGTTASWVAAAATGVTAISISSSNGFTGSSSGGSTPALTIATSVTGILKGNGTAISAATSGTDYSLGTSALATGILKSTTTTGSLTIAIAGDFPTLNQNTSGTAAGLSSTLGIGSGGTGQTTKSAAFDALSPMTTTGDLILGGASGTGTRLGIGSNNYVLTSNGTTASWAAATGGFADPMTTRGDTIIRNSSNITARLPIGSNGYVLTSDGTDISWAANVPGSSANLALSNLTSPTAINEYLIYGSGIAGVLATANEIGATTTDLVVSSGTVTSGIGNSGSCTLSSGNSNGTGNSGYINMGSGQTITGNSGDLNLYTGFVATIGNSGSVYIQSGESTSGDSGSVILNVGPATGTLGKVVVQNTALVLDWNSNSQLITYNKTSTNNSEWLYINSGTTVDGDSGGLNVESGSAAGVGYSGSTSFGSGTTFTGDSGATTLKTGDTYFAGATPGNSGGMNLYTGYSDIGTTGNIYIESGLSNAGGDTGNITLHTGTTSGTRGIINLQDASMGTAGHVWTSTNTTGAGHWAAASGGANLALSNLTSVAINSSLVFATGVDAILQSLTRTGASASANTLIQSGDVATGASGTLSLVSGAASGTAGTSGYLFINSGSTTTGPSGTLLIGSGSTTTGNSGSLLLFTGASSSSGTSGDIVLSVGITAGTKGKINFTDSSIGTSGHVWTSTDTLGNGHWAAPSGSISLAAIGSTPNANAATISGSTLNLEPASVSFGGVVTTGTQSFVGTKTFTGDTTLSANVNFTSHTNSSLTGANQRIPSHPTSNVHFTNASLTSIASGNNGGVLDGHILIITNETGSTITIVNNYASAAAGEKIITGTNADLLLPNNSSFSMFYNTSTAVWNINGTGITNLASSDVTGVLPIANGGTNSSTTLNNNRVMQSSGSAIVEAAAITAARVLISDANGIPTHSTITSTTLAFLDATSSIQTQLNAKQATGNYITALTGDVTASGPGSVAGTIANSAVTLAKMADMATASVFYRKTAGTGAPEVQTLATLKTDLGLTGTNSGDQTITLTGGVTGSGTGSFAATVVTNANLTGDITSVGNATTLTNAPVITKVLTGYTSGAGTVSATDSILQAIQKLNGNDATNANLTGIVTSVGNATAIADGALALAKLATTTAGFIPVGAAATGIPTYVAVSGDITLSSTGVTAIGTNKVTLAMQAQIATASIMGRTTAATGNVEVLTATQATTLLNTVVGDSGSGGTKGLAPAPASGDTAAGKFLKADGTWAVPSGGGSSAVPTGKIFNISNSFYNI